LQIGDPWRHALPDSLLTFSVVRWLPRLAFFLLAAATLCVTLMWGYAAAILAQSANNDPGHLQDTGCPYLSYVVLDIAACLGVLAGLVAVLLGVKAGMGIKDGRRALLVATGVHLAGLAVWVSLGGLDGFACAVSV